MANIQEEIIEMLTNSGYNYFVESDYEIYLDIDGMETYREPSGFDTAFFVIRMFSAGEHLDIFSPSCFKVPEEPEREALFFKACMILNWKSNLCKYKYEHTSGLFEAVVDFIIIDSSITQSQLDFGIREMIYFLNLSYPLLDKICKEGVLDLDLIDKRKWLSSFLGETIPPSKELLDEILGKEEEE